MAKSNCQQFFELQTENIERCKALQDIPEITQLAWELQTAANNSPGVVRNEELICRYSISPFHINPSGMLLPTAFSDASKLGLSVNRLGYTDIHHVYGMALNRVNMWNVQNPDQPERVLVGYVTFLAIEVREIFAEGTPQRRGFGIYDTATPADELKQLAAEPSHADVCQLVKDKKSAKSVRAQLFNLLSPRLVNFSSDSMASA